MTYMAGTNLNFQPNVNNSSVVLAEQSKLSEMGYEIKSYNHPQFGDIRIAEFKDGQILFCLSDLAKALGYVRPADAVTTHCKGVSILPTPTFNQYGAEVKQNMKFGKEGNIYRLTLSSKLPDAEKFQDWVCDDLLPTIRKTGCYSVQKPLTNKELALMVLQAEEEKERLMLENETQQKQIESQKPAVAFTNAVQSAKNSCLVGELAKILRQNGVKIGEKRLFRWLREHKYLGSHGERYNIPNQEYIERGYFELKEGVRSGSNGVLHTTITPKITGKGQVYFVNKFLSKNKDNVLPFDKE